MRSAAWPFLICALFFMGPIPHHPPYWVWVQEAPPRGREARKLRVCLFAFQRLPKGSSAWPGHSSP